MSEFRTVCRLKDLKEGEGKTVSVGGKLVALFLCKDSKSDSCEVKAIEDTCPHMGASLAEGYLDGHGVICPWHAWKFCVQTGTWLDNPKSNIKSQQFEVQVIGSEIRVLVLDPERHPSAQNPS